MSEMHVPPSYPTNLHNPAFPDDAQQKLGDKLKLLISEFRSLIHSMPDSHHDLDKIAKHIREVGAEVARPSTTHGRETAEVVKQILNQPLSIADSSESASLLEASKSFKKETPYESDLFKILSTLHEYPGPTRTLITELEILQSELKP